MTLYRRGGKRLFDLLAGTLLLVLVAPLMTLIAFMVRLGLGSPVLFRQSRPGLHGAPFKLIKFRTMASPTDANGRALSDRERLAPFGDWLRRMSLDELPELLHVVRGEMSLVGPRPLLMEYLPRYSEEQRRRHDVRPGLTGLAQVSGRNRLSWEEKFKLDVYYVDHCTFLLDLRILLRTVAFVHHGVTTVDEFVGRGGRPS